MITSPSASRRSARLLQASILLFIGGCSHPLAGQNSKTVAQANKAAPLLTLGPLSGQALPLLPLTYLLAADSIPGLPTDHAAQLNWADSIFAAQFQMRGPEVTWVLPAELRQIAKRAPGMVNEPDKLGQAQLRSSTLKSVPDQLLTNMRALMGMANARYAMVPASLLFTRSAAGVNVAATLSLIDARSGTILWHSELTGVGPTAAAALSAIFPRILP